MVEKYLGLIIDKHLGILITAIFTLLGIIIGAGLTYFSNKSQINTQQKIEMNKWRREKVIELTTGIFFQLNQLELVLFKSKSMNEWFNSFNKEFLPQIMIFLGYEKWAYINDEIIKLMKSYFHYLQGEIIAKNLKIEFLKNNLTDDYLENLKPEDSIDYNIRIQITQVNIQTALTDFLKDNFTEFKELDYRNTPKFEI